MQRGLFPTQKLLGGDFSGENLIYDPLTFDAPAVSFAQAVANALIGRAGDAAE